MTGNLTGDLTGHLTGDLTGHLTGNLTGLSGYLTGRRAGHGERDGMPAGGVGVVRGWICNTLRIDNVKEGRVGEGGNS